MRFHHEKVQAQEVMVVADALAMHLRPQVGVAWMPQGTQQEVMTPGKKMSSTIWRERCISQPANCSMASALANTTGYCATSCPGWTGRSPRHGARASLSWWLTIVCIKRKPSSRGWQATRVLRRSGCRCAARGPSRWSGRLALCTTNVPGTTNGNVCAMAVQDVVQHIRDNGPWKYNLSRLYQAPEVTAAVEHMALEAPAKLAACVYESRVG